MHIAIYSYNYTRTYNSFQLSRVHARPFKFSFNLSSKIPPRICAPEQLINFVQKPTCHFVIIGRRMQLLHNRRSYHKNNAAARKQTRKEEEKEEEEVCDVIAASCGSCRHCKVGIQPEFRDRLQTFFLLCPAYLT
jgi:hypothetical protein